MLDRMSVRRTDPDYTIATDVGNLCVTVGMSSCSSAGRDELPHIVLVLVVLPTSPRRLKLQTSFRL
jgi:hypothetical protein